MTNYNEYDKIKIRCEVTDREKENHQKKKSHGKRIKINKLQTCGTKSNIFK